MTTATATKLNIRPLNDRLVIRRLEAKDTTAGGIVLPDTAKEKPKEGIVVALGEGKILKDGTRATFTVKADDKVLFGAYAGSEVKLDGEEFLIIGEDEILAIVS